MSEKETSRAEELPRRQDQGEDPRVVEILQQIRAGVRQRQAERAAILSDRQRGDREGEQWLAIDEKIAELRASSVVVERPFVSDVPILGPLIVFVRRAWNNVAARWFVLPLVQQQNRFNQMVVDAVRESLRSWARLDKRIDTLDARLDEMLAKIDRVDQHLDQLDLRLISSDRDMTSLARKIAEREYKVREWKGQAARERDDLVHRLDRFEEMLLELTDESNR